MSFNEYFHPVKIGGVEILGNLFLAPVAGYSDEPFRSICIDWGASFCYTEMVSSEALTRDSKKTIALMSRAENESMYAIQLFGSDPLTMARASEIASKLKPTIIDINSGCPVQKIIKSGAGSALMNDPVRLAAIVREMTRATDIPITVKIRTGWDASSINYLEVAERCQDAGAKAITLHARTRAMQYSGTADWDCIKKLKSALSVPVFGSGDIFKAQDALRMLKETRCDAIMVARGMMGNPFIFREILELSDGKPIEPHDAILIADTVELHLRRFIAFAGEHTACLEFRKHFCAYTKGLQHGAGLRNEAVQANTFDDYSKLFARLKGY